MRGTWFVIRQFTNHVLCIMVHIFYNLIWVVSCRPPYAIMQMDAIPIRLATAKGGMVTLTCNGMPSEDDWFRSRRHGLGCKDARRWPQIARLKTWSACRRIWRWIMKKLMVVIASGVRLPWRWFKKERSDNGESFRWNSLT